MKLQSPRLVKRDDIPGAPEWLDKMLSPFNSTIESMAEPLQKQLSHKDNMNSEIFELRVTHEVEFQFRLNTLKGRPLKVSVCQVTNPVDYQPRFKWELSADDARVVKATASFLAGAGEYTLCLLAEGN